MTGQKNTISKTTVLVVGLSLILTGCGSGEESPAETETPEANVALLEVGAPLRDPVWSPEEEVVLALRQDGQALVKADTTLGGLSGADEPPQAVTLAEEFEGGAGENMVLDRQMPDLIFIPQPDLDQVKVMEKDDLLEVRTFGAGPPPVRVTIDDQAALAQAEKTLFALSEDGSTVSGVSIEDYEVVEEVEVDQDEGALLEASREINGRDFWIAGSGGVAYYAGSPLELRAKMPIEAGALAVDAGNPERAYVSEAASGRLVAVEPGSGSDLEPVAETDVGGKVLYLAADEERLYAVTRDELFVLNPTDLEPLQTLNFKRPLEEEALKRAESSGIAIGEESIYLTLKGEPYMLQIEKP